MSFFTSCFPTAYLHWTQLTGGTEDECSSADRPDESTKQTDQEVGHQCSACGKSFPSLSAAKRHQKVHANFHCGVCGNSFFNELGLKKHVRRTHASGPNMPLKTSSKRVQESEEKGNPCPECEKCFSTWKNLFQHQRSVHRETTRQQCEECGAFFCRKWSLDRHMRSVHGTENNHICLKCGATFSCLNGLKKHVGIMHNLDPTDKNS
ncbi:zinc finger protein 383 [Clonorchis sinensis]|uniref:Zinc finger protein 383 n=1 Tax=Clonorchis sinensis TaxID=79923 RepID=G7YWJ2_CLOSI|nr:zinc finger protein 383 [Clonorchis sinensis]